MSQQIEKEEAVQRALGTLSRYRVSVFGPYGGLLGKYDKAIDAITPVRAIYLACLTLSISHRARFLQSHRLSWKGRCNFNCCSAHIQLDNDYVHAQLIRDLRLILDIDGNIHKDLSKEILDKLKCVQKGKHYHNTLDEECGGDIIGDIGGEK